VSVWSQRSVIDYSLQRLERAIAGLIAVEEVILTAASEKLLRLGGLNASVEAHERRFAALADELR